MKAKEYLLKIEKNEKLINNKRDELFKLRCLIEGSAVDFTKDAVQAGNGKKLENLISQIVDLESEIINDYASAVLDMEERISVIEKLDDTLEYEVLYRRYVKYQSLQQVSEELNYGYEWICRVHGKALNKIQKILETSQ